MKNKKFDEFSFKAASSEGSEVEIGLEEFPLSKNKMIKPSEIQYRHPDSKPKISIFDHDINHKISQISDELDQNIRRRMELQIKLEGIKQQEKNKMQREVFMTYNGNRYKEEEEVARNFKKMNQKADKISQLVVQKSHMKPEEVRIRQIQKSKEILMNFDEPLPISNKQKIIIPILQTLSSQKKKPLPVYTVPDQIKIQQLLRRVKFPEVPSGNLQSLRKQIEHLFAVHQPHSDIHYLLMVIYFHEQKYTKVRKHYEQIIMFKVYNEKACWIAAEAEFAMDNHQLCLKLTEECVNRLEERLLPRLVYMKARSYECLGNYLNSIICYNQLIKMKPKISEYYLERGLLYHRIGYYKESKQDFVMFGILNPQGQQLIKDRILGEPNEIKKKEYIAMLAKMY